MITFFFTVLPFARSIKRHTDSGITYNSRSEWAQGTIYFLVSPRVKYPLVNHNKLLISTNINFIREALAMKIQGI